MTNTTTSESDFSFAGLWSAVTANPLARDSEGEHNFLGFAGTLTTVTWSIATNLLPSQGKAVAAVVSVTYGAIFSGAGQVSDGDFTMRDGFELAGGIIGGVVVGGVAGMFTGGLGSFAAGYVGGQAGGYIGGSIYDYMFDADAPDIRARVSDVDFNNHPAVVTNNSDGSETHNHTDPNSGQQVQTRVIVDPQTGQKTGVYSTVIDPTSPLRGMTYPVNAVKNGYELNALDRISEETHARALVKKKQEEAAAIARAKADRDRQGGGGGSSDDGGSRAGGATYGGSSGSGQPPARSGDGGLGGGFNYGGSTYGTGTATRGATPSPTEDRRPIVIDLDGDGVEISPLGGSTARFDYDGDGFKELTAWVGKDDGLLVYDIGNDGQITQTREVVIADFTADTTDTDLDALKAVFDTNNDGILNANDTGWANFKIWNDADQDGTVDSGEMSALAGRNIKSLDLTRKENTKINFSDGTILHGLFDVETTNGTKVLGGDLAFAYKGNSGVRETVNA